MEAGLAPAIYDGVAYMAGKGSFETTPLKQLQRYHHTTLNTFGDGETLVEAIHRRPGIYGPNPIAYLSVLARRPSLTLGDLDEALINDRSLVRATAFRGSLFLLAAEDYPLYFRALHDSLAMAGMSRLRSEGIDEVQMQRFADRLLSVNFTMQKTESQLTEILFPREKSPGQDVERTLLRKLCDIGVLVRTTTKGWKGNQFNYALTKHWLETGELVVENVDQARTEVVRHYLRAYGPARFEDIVWWTGVPAAEVKRVIDALGREVVKLLVDGLGEGLVTLREMVDSTRKGGVGVPDRILFLPLWDAYALGWRDRTRVVDPRFAPWVYDPQGMAASVIVEEGRAIGLWQFRDGDTVTLEFHIFEPYNNRLNAVRLAAETHAAQLAMVAGSRDVRVIERALPAPLAERPAASFLWPLGKEPIFRHSDTDYDNPMDRRERTPNVLRSKFLDDERLVRPMAEEELARARPRPTMDRPAAQIVVEKTMDKAETSEAIGGEKRTERAIDKIERLEKAKQAEKAERKGNEPEKKAQRKPQQAVDKRPTSTAKAKASRPAKASPKAATGKSAPAAKKKR